MKSSGMAKAGFYNNSSLSPNLRLLSRHFTYMEARLLSASLCPSAMLL